MEENIISDDEFELSSVSSDSSDNDGSTIAEYDVFLNQDINDLYVVQYPLIPENSTSLPKPTKALFRKTNQDLELKYSTKSSNEFYQVAEGAVETDFQYLTLKSHKILKDENLTPTFTIGIFNENLQEVNLVPIKNIFSMTPDMSNLDNDFGEDTEMKEPTNEAKTVQVYQLRKETEEASEYRKRTFNYIKEQIAKEEPKEINITEGKANELTLTEKQDKGPIFETKNEYLNALAPLQSEN